MRRVAIVGGGIAGLSAAYYLEKAGRNRAELDWTLYEKSNRLGGVVRTEERDGFVLEAGADSFLTAKPDAAELCRELGIDNQIIQSNDFQRKTYIFVEGRLTPLPDGLQFMVPTRILPMVSTSLFSLGTKLRMAAECFTAAGNHREDESVAAFVRRHFGQEMVDRVAEPLLAGVYGGNAEHLSVKAVLPRFAEMEARHGSLVRATLHARKNAAATAAPQPLFTSLRNGMQQLVDAVAAALPRERVRLGDEVTSLQPAGEKWAVNGESFDAVVLALPAPIAASLLRQVNTDISARLEKITYTSSVAVVLAYDHLELPPGFGFLVPASERRRLLACTFVHNKFTNRAPAGTALLRCFFSSSRTADLMEYSEDQCQAIARQELREILGLNAQPRFAQVFRWLHALPQYETGHLERVAEIENRLKQLPGLYLIGNSLHGVGIPDCVKSGREVAQAIAKPC